MGSNSPFSSFLRGAVVCALAVGSVAASAAPAQADTIYVAQGAEPQVQAGGGWTPEWKDVARSGKPYKAIRGRIVRTSAPGSGPGIYFQVLLKRTRRGTQEFRYDAKEHFFTQTQVKGLQHDFDSMQDLRWLLGNDDIRLAEALIKQPRLLTAFFPNTPAARMRPMLSAINSVRGAQQPDPEDLMPQVRHGTLPAVGFLYRRMGFALAGIPDPRLAPTYDRALDAGEAQATTPFRRGWLTLLIERGPPASLAAYTQRLKQHVAQGNHYSALSLLPYNGGANAPAVNPRPANPPVAGPAPGMGTLRTPGRMTQGADGYYRNRNPGNTTTHNNAATNEADLLHVNLKPRVYLMLLAVAQSTHYRDIFDGPALQGRNQGRFGSSVLASLRNLTLLSSLAVPPGADPAFTARVERARQVGRLTREAVIEALEAAALGRNSPFDPPSNPADAARVARLARAGYGAGTYLPVDPSEVALAALHVIQSNPNWSRSVSGTEAKRLIRALVEISRMPLQADRGRARSTDVHRVGRSLYARGPAISRLRREVLRTLASPVHNGLLAQPGIDLATAGTADLLAHGLTQDEVRRVVAGRAQHDVRSSDGLVAAGFNEEHAGRLIAQAGVSPYLDPMIKLMGEFDLRDQQLLRQALTISRAVSVPSPLFKQVTDQLFATLLDNREWQVDGHEEREIKADALATLGALAERTGAGRSPAADQIFTELDRIIASEAEGKCSSEEKRLLEMINDYSRTAPVPALTTIEPSAGLRRQYAAVLNRAYRQHLGEAEVEFARRRRAIEAATGDINQADRLAELEAEIARIGDVRRAVGGGTLVTPAGQ